MKNQNIEILAKETFYNGYRFRSRLEAKWAVFFDSLGIKWEYEAKDFTLPSGRYLPDFYFPDIGVFAEVKPKELDNIELKKCKELSCQINKTSGAIDVVLLEGMPSFTEYRTISEGQIFVDVVFLGPNEKFYPFYYSKFDKFYCEKTFNAIVEARSMRFEFNNQVSV